MRIISPIEKKKYILNLRGQMESWFAFGQRRFTGVVWGSFFCITSHGGFEWNRRYTSPKNRAIGFVKESGEGSEVSVILTAGLMDPVSILFLYGLYVFCIASQGGRWITPNPTEHIFAIILALVTAFISYITDSFTQRGQESLADLVTLLRNPVPIWEESYE